MLPPGIDNTSVIPSVYCPNVELCGRTRVGIVDFGNPETPCPDGLIEHVDGVVRACKRDGTTDSIMITTGTGAYSQVCGTVRGYQLGSPDAFDPDFTGADRDNIESNSYFDGISITYGSPGSRQHIFSLAVGIFEGNQCPCDTGSTHTPSSFVGTDYICESGNPGTTTELRGYYNDILWDGQQCRGNESPCCTASPYIPYFYKDLGTDTNKDIELRILTNQSLDNEDILLLSYEVYVK